MSIDSTTEDLLVECCKSTKVCAKALFPDRFTRDFSSGHDEIFDILDDDSEKRVVIASPRGTGKTSCVNLVLPAQRILFKKSRYIVPISRTATAAEEQALNLRRELDTNETINKLFGSLKTPIWSRSNWEACLEGDDIGTKVNPRGAGQQIRGLIHRNSRPDLIIVDDADDPQSVRSEEQRSILKSWFNKDVCNSIDRGSDNWRIIVIGTVLHEDSLLQNLIESKDWTSIVLQICDEDTYESRWPEFMSTEEVKKIVEEHREEFRLDEFYMEYMNMPISKEDSTFKQEMFNYYEPSDPIDKEAIRTCQTIVIVDPAKTVKPQSADSAIVGVGVDTVNGKLYVRDVIAGKLHPDELYKETVDMCKRLGSYMIGLEVTSLNEFITQPFENYIRMHSSGLTIIELSARKKKEDRITALIPYYRQRLIYHNKAVTRQLEQQLLAFPRSKRFDIMDALAYIVEMMEKGGRYFSDTVTPTESKADIEKEYDCLRAEDEREPDLGLEWQLVGGPSNEYSNPRI